MKKNLFFITFITVFVLIISGCGSSSNTTSSTPTKTKTKEEKAAAPAKQKEVSNKSSNNIPEPKKDKNGNIILDVPGQKINDPQMGTVELLKIKKVNQTVNIKPLKVTIEDVKILKVTNLADDAKKTIEYYSQSTIPHNDLTYIQVKFNVENTSDKNIEWNGLQNIVTDKKEQIDGNNDFLVDDSDTDTKFLGKVKKEYTNGYILKDPQIQKFKLIFGSSMDADSLNDITAEQQVEYNF